MTPEQFVAVITALGILAVAVTRLLFQVQAMLEAQRAQHAQMNGLQAQLVSVASEKARAEGVLVGQAHPVDPPAYATKAPS